MPIRSRLSSLRRDGSVRASKPLRAGMTDAERRLWYYLRAGRLQGHYFRRQVPIGDYVVDFVCERSRLVVEADGGQHADLVARDESRSRWLNAHGYRVMRFWNNDVLANTAGVLETIVAALDLDPLPGPLPREREKI